MAENNYNYYSTFVFYDERGRRLSVFAEKVEGQEKLSISILRCSLKDMFTKKIGRQLFEDGEAEEIAVIDIEEGFPKKTFLSYCRKNFFQVKTFEITTPLDILVRVTKIDEAETPQIGNEDD